MMASGDPNVSTTSTSSFSATDFPPDRILELLQSRQRPDRDHGLTVLGKILIITTTGECHSRDPVLVEKCSKLLQDVQQLIMHSLQENIVNQDAVIDSTEELEAGINSEKVWEVYGCLSASLAIAHKTVDLTSEQNRQFLDYLQQLTLRLICDQDVRVRLLAGK